MTATQNILKRLLDFSLSLIGLLVLSPILIIGWILASYSTRSNGFFIQERIGLYGKKFKVFKLKTMKDSNCSHSSVTALNENRITRVGLFLRKTKVDELPQLINVLFGQMSFVGPRPDVPGFADILEGDDRVVLQLRPGITGLATIYFRYEEDILNKVSNPETFNSEIIFPLKVILNKQYFSTFSFKQDVDCILQTACGLTIFSKSIEPIKTPEECANMLDKYNVKN
ncbi:sugar transferase [Photobacterium sp. SDRW27]|uniref:sugar transferase n=1 Tax=Photobacterium obscurum TaxID=2829490 RepID=UPI002244D34D|nr:sugar transferase [Photobacterium obscurum]MCW8328236.1 sugar transferase [Photobacterium obscurum]